MRARLALVPALGGGLGRGPVLFLGLAGGCRSVSEIAPPALTLRDVAVRAFSGGVADLTLEVEVENANDFEVTLVALSGDLEIEGAEIGRLAWSGEHDCPKRRASRVRIPLHCVVGEHGGLLAGLIDRRPLHHALRGEATFARGVIRRAYPVATEGQLAPAAGSQSGRADGSEGRHAR